MGRHPSLQNGGPTHPKRPAKAGRLAGKGRLEDAYLTVPIHPDYQHYLQFSIEGVNYQFTCLPFGLACAPWAFTKVMKAIVTLLRSWGTRIIIYIDNNYPNNGGVSITTSGGANSHPGMAGVYHQYQEVSNDPPHRK